MVGPATAGALVFPVVRPNPGATLPGMRRALFLPIFDELAEPRAVATLAAEAEEHGWDGLFVWDHITYRAPVVALADPWVTLAAVACATERLRIGPMVTPLPRRRPVVLARQTATLDRLSRGRLTLGVGIGGDGSGELSTTGEQTDDRLRGAMLDEGLEVLQAAWAGEQVDYHGKHYLDDGLTFLPTPVQRPGPPIWVAARYGSTKPLARAARFDGLFPIGIEEPAQLAEVVAEVGREEGFDVMIGLEPGVEAGPYEGLATWAAVAFPITTTVDTVRGVLREGPRP